MTKWRRPSVWKLMVTTLPLVAGVVGMKLFLEEVAGYRGSVEFSDITAVLTAVAFLIGFMLAGTMADFKEAEKIPGDLACALEAVEESLAFAAVRKGGDVRQVRTKVLELTTALSDYLAGRRSVAQAYDAFGSLDPVLEELDKLGGTAFVTRAMSKLGNARKALTRVEVISNTGFLAPGYALLDVMVVSTVILLMITRFKSALVEYVLVTFITLIYFYMVRLIRDIDNPFELSRLGSAEVDPAPLLAYRERAELRLAQSAGTRRRRRFPRSRRAGPEDETRRPGRDGLRRVPRRARAGGAARKQVAVELRDGTAFVDRISDLTASEGKDVAVFEARGRIAVADIRTLSHLG